MSQFFKEYQINYNLNGGINHPNNPSAYNNQMDEIILQTPTRNGYDFDGWFTDSDFNTPIISFNPSEEAARNDLITEIQVPFEGIDIIAIGTEFATSNTFFYAWGVSTYRRHGYNAPTSPVTIPYRQNFDKNVSLYMGYRSLFYLFSGELFGIGHNNQGILSQGDTIDPTDYVLIPETTNGSGELNFTINKIKDFKIGPLTMAIVDFNGDFYICGHNAYGSAGDGTTENILSLRKINTISNVKKILSIGAFSTVVQKDDGSVWLAGWTTFNPIVQTIISNLFGYNVISNEYLYTWKEIKILKDVEELKFYSSAGSLNPLDNWITEACTRVSLMAKFKDKFIIYGTNTDGMLGTSYNRDSDINYPMDISYIFPELFNYNDDINTAVTNFIRSFHRHSSEIKTILPANPKDYSINYFPLLTINHNNANTILDYYDLNTKTKVKTIKILNEYIEEFIDTDSEKIKFIIRDNRAIIFGGQDSYKIFTFELTEKSRIEAYPLSHNIIYSPIPQVIKSDIKSNKKITIGINSMENERDIVPKSFYIKRENINNIENDEIPITRDKREYVYDTQTLSRAPELSKKVINKPFDFISGSTNIVFYKGKLITELDTLVHIIEQTANSIPTQSVGVLSFDDDSLKIMGIKHINYAKKKLLVRDIGNRQLKINRENKIIYPYLPTIIREISKLNVHNNSPELVLGLYYKFINTSREVKDSIFNIYNDELLSSEMFDKLDRYLYNYFKESLTPEVFSRILTNTETYEELKEEYRNGVLLLGDQTF